MLSGRSTPSRLNRASSQLLLRLDSLPRIRNTPTRTQRPPKPSLPTCKNPECSDSDVGEDDGKLICRNCGFIVQEINITQELTFGEASNGAAVVQGVYVGANDETARNPALGSSKVAGGMDSRQITERNGLHHISNLVAALRLSITYKERAMQIYRLSMNINFIQGRTTREVAAVCLYIACRRDSECRMMLIDFSDLLEVLNPFLFHVEDAAYVLKVNVFRLGSVYNTLVQELGLRSANHVSLYDVNPENLIQRFAQDLEFGPDEHKIANEAVQIVKRMKRDWMLTGRRPAGVCAAALILAARMNNYRRTVREVVYTAKVADITIHKRLDEFTFTESSRLTVEEFRHHGLELEKDHDPPAFYEQFIKKNKRRKKSSGTAEDEMSEVGSQRGESLAPTDAVASTNLPLARTVKSRKQAQKDKRAMPPPPIPVDPALLQASMPEPSGQERRPGDDGTDSDAESDAGTVISTTTGQKRKRGRPTGSKNVPLPKPTARAIEDENQMESEINALLEDEEVVADAAETVRALQLPTPQPTQQSQPSSSQLAYGARASSLESTNTLDPELQPPTTRPSRRRPISDSEIIDPSEFDSDPEIANCLLTPTEIAIHERIWVHHNGDYLRAQQARRIRAELAAASGTARVVQRRKRRRGRMGDMSKYQTVAEDGTVTGPASSADATKEMLKRRGYSRKINYRKIDALYDKGSRNGSGSGSAGGSASVSRSQTGSARASPRASSVATEVSGSARSRTQSPFAVGPVGARIPRSSSTTPVPGPLPGPARAHVPAVGAAPQPKLQAPAQAPTSSPPKTQIPPPPQATKQTAGRQGNELDELMDDGRPSEEEDEDVAMEDEDEDVAEDYFEDEPEADDGYGYGEGEGEEEEGYEEV